MVKAKLDINTSLVYFTRWVEGFVRICMDEYEVRVGFHGYWRIYTRID